MTSLMRTTALAAVMLAAWPVAAQTTEPAEGEAPAPAADAQTPTGTRDATADAAGGKPPVDAASEQLEDPLAADVAIVGHVLEPKQLQPTPERLARLKLPEGFSIDVFADNLINPRMIAVADDGTVYVTRREVGDVLMLRDADGDGKAEERKVAAARPQMHGIALDGNNAYLVTVNDVYRTERQADGTFGALDRIIDDLPDGGQHPNRTLTVGPDGKLYISAGSTCNACAETNPENATILRAEPDGSSRTIYASGLRNTIGFGFHPESGELYGMDHGIDWLGDNEQQEELNHIQRGNKYGWPYIYADSKINPQDDPPGGVTHEEWARESQEPALMYTPHAAPMQMAFYEGGPFPAEYDGDAFVAMRGSWNRQPPSGYEIVRIDFENGKPAAIEPFITGFLMREGEGWGHLGRLAGLAVANDGALLLSDDKNGVIYRIAYTGSGSPEAAPAAEAAQTAATQPAQDPDPKPAEGPDEMGKLAGQLVEAKSGSIDVATPSFENGAPIPVAHAAEGHDASPALRWGKGPEGTRSYVILMEDPDVKEEPPFVHWIAYNIPAEVTELREGIPPLPKLQEPKDTLQGANDRGSLGYFGPRPPVEDPAHHYHFQVFALDTVLDLPHGADRGQVLDAIDGHVLSTGEVMGTYER